MAVQQLTLPGTVVKKRNELIRSRINISNVDASRILANLIACVRRKKGCCDASGSLACPSPGS
jgi:hypothetical protein